MRQHQKTGAVPGEGRHESDAGKLAQTDRPDFDKDLRPPEDKGQNNPESHCTNHTRNTYKMKDLHEKFPQLSSADLKQIAILPLGSTLEQGAIYLDLNRLEEGEFKARRFSNHRNQPFSRQKQRRLGIVGQTARPRRTRPAKFGGKFVGPGRFNRRNAKRLNFGQRKRR